jgi:predicted transcriptional regulator/bacterioferritin-associated ferredoxin
MTEVVVSPPLDIAGQIERVEEAGELFLRGYRESEIAQILEVTPVQAKKYVEEYKWMLQNEVNNDPHFLDRIGLNTLKTLKELEDIQKEAWETVKVATDNGMVTARTQALKLSLEVTTKKAQLQQLLSAGTKDNSDAYARTQKAETVNQLLSKIIRDVIGDCEKCRERARDMLAQAFSLMEDEQSDDEDVIDVESSER